MRIDRERLLAVAASIAMTAAILASQAYLVESAIGAAKAQSVPTQQTATLPVSDG